MLLNPRTCNGKATNCHKQVNNILEKFTMSFLISDIKISSSNAPVKLDIFTAWRPTKRLVCPYGFVLAPAQGHVRMTYLFIQCTKHLKRCFTYLPQPSPTHKFCPLPCHTTLSIFPIISNQLCQANNKFLIVWISSSPSQLVLKLSTDIPCCISQSICLCW